MDIKALLSKNDIVTDPQKDQFFLINNDILNIIIDLGELSKTDTVLEVGAGIGNLTELLAKKAGKVISFEIDPRFRPVLKTLPDNVELHYENAWNYVQLHGKFRKKKEYNKIISNLPYSFCEPFLHNLTFLKYDKAILLIPSSFLQTLKTHPIFQSFFLAEEKLVVGKENFFPILDTKSVVIDLLKLPDPLEKKNLPLFLRQYIYQHEDQKVRNSLMEGLVDYAKLAFGEKVTKNEAREIIVKTKIPNILLDSTPNSREIYDKISESYIDFPFK